MKDERAHLQLFDLIARDWVLASPATQVIFNATDTAVAFACADGSIHLAATADKSSPTQRTRRAVDTARLTIAPRDKPHAPLKSADFTDGRSSSVVRHGPVNFAFAKDTGRVNTLTPGGTAVHLPDRAGGSIQALGASAHGDVLACATGAEVHIFREGAAPQTLRAVTTISDLAFSPDGRILAVAHEAGLSRWLLDALGDGPVNTPLNASPVTASWSSDGAHLLCCMETDGFCVVDAATNSALHHGSFPSAVRSAAFSPVTGTVVAAGAFRVAGWTMNGNQDVMTGKPGLVLIDSLATSPTRNLVAVGYANGLLSLAEIGRPSEILLRENTGAAITAMAWSANGRFLALAGTDGSAALVEFPDSMFKS